MCTQVVRQGSDITLVGWGAQLSIMEQACLDAEKVSDSCIATKITCSMHSALHNISAYFRIWWASHHWRIYTLYVASIFPERNGLGLQLVHPMSACVRYGRETGSVPMFDVGN